MTRAEAQKRAKVSAATAKAAKSRRRPYTFRNRDSVEYLEYRVRFLPEQLARARARLKQLEAEAIALGMRNLLECKQ